MHEFETTIKKRKFDISKSDCEGVIVVSKRERISSDDDTDCACNV